jgi:ABC-type uncharacterized transport system ATPase subunit
MRINDWEKCLDRLFELKKEIVVVDIPKLKALLKKVEEASLRVKDKNVILFLGNTGAGKSTTIHYLAGSKMVKTLVDGISHIGPA